MKLLTLNTHSLVEEKYEQKLQDFAEAVSKERPDIIALQEVNQTASEDAVPECDLNGYFPADKNAVIRRDNHVYRLVRILAEKGIYYSWTWLPLKLGYDKYVSFECGSQGDREVVVPAALELLRKQWEEA